MARTECTPGFSVIEGVELPDTLCELIDLAVSDIRSFNRDVFLPVSSIWLEKESTDSVVCAGCLSGAIMYSRLIDMSTFVDDNIGPEPNEFSIKYNYKLLALDFFRTGGICYALNLLYADTDPETEIGDLLRGPFDNYVYEHLDETDENFLKNPPNGGSFESWPEMDQFLAWADTAADILRKYEYPIVEDEIEQDLIHTPDRELVFADD